MSKTVTRYLNGLQKTRNTTHLNRLEAPLLNYHLIHPRGVILYTMSSPFLPKVTDPTDTTCMDGNVTHYQSEFVETKQPFGPFGFYSQSQ